MFQVYVFITHIYSVLHKWKHIYWVFTRHLYIQALFCSLSSSPLLSVPDVSAGVVETPLVRSRRNAPVFALPQYQRLPDFWGWYKYFMQSHNQEGVSGVSLRWIIQLLPLGIRMNILVFPRNQLEYYREFFTSFFFTPFKRFFIITI